MLLRWLPLEKIAEVTQGATLSRLKDPKGKAVPVVQIRNLNTLEVGGDLEVGTFDVQKAGQYRAREGQVLVSLRGVPVKASVVPDREAEWMIGSNLAIITPQDNVDPYYLAGLLRSEFMNQKIDKLIGGVTVASLSLKQLRLIELPLLVEEEQRVLSNAFRALDKYTLLTQELVRLRVQRTEAQLLKLFGEAHD
jgi:restriction endonuclease S subunit